jgi:predicted metal-binding membrane protein
MALSFALGAMNIVWMALLGAAMILERTIGEPRALVYGIGVGLIGAGGVLL